MAEAPNADQHAYWNGGAGERWAALQRDIDSVFEDLTAHVIDAAAPTQGEKAIDIGCGCGTTALELARRVGPSGSVAGFDISRPMLAIAEERARAGALGNVTLTLADASTHAFAAGGADLVFSRFGVMFFEKPAAAFVNIRTALKPNGRVLFACWRAVAENPWFNVPLQVALPHAPPQPPSDPLAPGPFAFADPDHVRTILSKAGFQDVDLRPLDVGMRLAAPEDLEAATAFVMKIGPTSRLLADVGEAARRAAIDDIRAALADFDGIDGIVLKGAIWIVSART